MQVELRGGIGEFLTELTELRNEAKNEMKKIRIKPECVDLEDIEGLQALIKAAYNDACEKLKEQSDPSNFAGMPDLSSMLNF